MEMVFIGGCGRSGTTLLGAMLGAGKNCICTPEAQFVFEGLRKGPTEKINRKQLEHISKHWSMKTWGLSEEEILSNSGSSTNYASLLDHLVLQYSCATGQPNSSVWVNHTPENVIFADTLFKLYPKARMIHLVRDGRAVAASVLPLDWGPSTIFMAAHWWLEKLSSGLAAETAWPRQVMRVHYEDLVLKPSETLIKICSFLKITYEDSMLNANGFIKPAYTADQHSLVGRAPDQSRLQAWRKKLTAREIEIFESITGDILPVLGYDHVYGIQAKKPEDSERISTLFEEVYHYLVNRFRYKKRLRILNPKKNHGH